MTYFKYCKNCGERFNPKGRSKLCVNCRYVRTKKIILKPDFKKLKIKYSDKHFCVCGDGFRNKESLKNHQRKCIHFKFESVNQ